MFKDLDWCAVVPMANEEKEFPGFAGMMRSTLDDLESGRVYFVVDAVSRDNTLGLCRELAARDSRFTTLWVPDNKHIVGAYVLGFKEALRQGHGIIIEMDAGMSHDPRAIPGFLRVLREGNECAFGSRYINGGSMVDSAFERRLLSKGGTWAARILLGSKLGDMTSGFQGFHRSVLEKLVEYPLRSRAHFYQTEVRHLLRNSRLIEVPIHYRAPSPRVSRKAIADSLRVLFHYTVKRMIGQSPSI